MIARLRELGYPVVLVDASDLDSIAGQVEIVGRHVGAEEEANSLAADIRLQLRELTAGNTTSGRVKVFWQLSMSRKRAI